MNDADKRSSLLKYKITTVKTFYCTSPRNFATNKKQNFNSKIACFTEKEIISFFIKAAKPTNN
jgi:hypothetical protein